MLGTDSHTTQTQSGRHRDTRRQKQTHMQRERERGPDTVSTHRNTQKDIHRHTGTDTDTEAGTDADSQRDKGLKTQEAGKREFKSGLALS